MDLDFDRIAYVTSGVIIGSLLDRTTTLVLILTWILVANKPLPAAFGGILPQSLFFLLINYGLNFITLPITKIRNYRQINIERDQIRELLIEKEEPKMLFEEVVKQAVPIPVSNLIPPPKLVNYIGVKN